jgi:predicted nucleotidyltransferase
MGKYSVRGSSAFDARIDADMQRIADAVYSSKFSRHWKALVLLGGYGRGEGSPMIAIGGEELPYNDYDLIVVTDSLRPAPELKRLEKQLSEEIGLPVDLYPYLEQKLPSCEFSLLNYEMKYGHRVIRGDEKILDAMPDYPHNAIPLSEGTRLLLNRGKLLLDLKRRLAQPGPLSGEERQRFIKFLFKLDLAFGDCALLINEQYDISYTVKKTRVTALENLPEGIAAAYLKAIEFKERTDFQTLEYRGIHERFAETLRRYEQVFLWYERRRLKRKFQTLENYARSFPNLGNEGSPLKNAVRNLRLFGSGARFGLFAHPRLRLYAALPLLLARQADSELIAGLLNSQQVGFEELCKKFYAFQQRFS